MWCPKCESIQACKGVSPKDVNSHLQSGQRFYMKQHKDIQFFRRGRICQKCGHQFLTAEASNEFLTELIELRDHLGEVKKHVENYIEKSRSTMASIAGLSMTLGKLRALDVYESHE